MIPAKEENTEVNVTSESQLKPVITKQFDMKSAGKAIQYAPSP